MAEFLALTHDTAYAGYAASGSLEDIQEQPFFGAAMAPSTRPVVSSPRRASLARKSPSSPRKNPTSPRKAIAAQIDRTNTGIHDAVMHPITCTPSSTFKEVTGQAVVVLCVHLLHYVS